MIAEMKTVESTGNIQAMIQAFQCGNNGWGVLDLVGVSNKDDAFKTYPINLLNQRTLEGAGARRAHPFSDINKALFKR